MMRHLFISFLPLKCFIVRRGDELSCLSRQMACDHGRHFQRYYFSGTTNICESDSVTTKITNNRITQFNSIDYLEGVLYEEHESESKFHGNILIK